VTGSLLSIHEPASGRLQPWQLPCELCV